MIKLTTTPPETLVPIKDLQFFEAEHRYLFKGQWVNASVTQICSFDKSPLAIAQIMACKHEWEPRGNTVHACLEAFLKGQELPPHDDYTDWVEPLLAHPLWQQYRCVASELRMVSPDGAFAGSCDAVLGDDDEAILVDLKTQSTASKRPYSTDRQLGAYAWLLEKNYGLQVARCVTVWSKPGVVSLSTTETDTAVQAWLDAYDAWQLIHAPF